MAVKKLCASMPASILILIVIIWVATPGEVLGGSVYRYVNKDGSVVYTDNPPPGVNAELRNSFKEMPKEEKVEWGKEEDLKMQKYREEEARRISREKEIGPAKEEYEKAQSTLDHYRANVNRAHGDQYSRLLYWKKKVQEQEEEVAEKKKILDELENKP